jgi:hypothetical protein
VVGSASAQDHDLVLPAGIACADFDPGLDFGVDAQNLHEFTDASGTVVRDILAGRANWVTLTNMVTDAPRDTAIAPISPLPPATRW